MKTNKIKILTGIILLGGFIFVNAQEQDDGRLVREMTLEREYDPTIQDANKVNRLPDVREPEVTKHSIEYSPFTIPANPEKEIIVLPSGEIMTTIPFDKRRGYFHFGGGMYMNLNGDLGYHFLNDEKDKLNFYFSHRSTNGNVEYLQLPGEKQKAVLNDNLAVLDFKHYFNPAVLRLGGSFGYTQFNYYGLPFGSYFASLADPTVNPLDSLADRTTKQGNQTINAYAGIQSKDYAKIGYLLDFEFLRFDQKYGISELRDGVEENKYTVRLGLSSGLGYGNQRIGIAGKIDYYNFTSHTMYDPTYWNDKYTETTITPYYQTGRDNWKARLGVNVIYTSTEYTDRNFFVSPDIAIEAEVADKTVFYVNAGGEIQSNDFYGLSKQNRYMRLSRGGVSPSLTWLDGTLGVRSGVVPGLWFDLFAGYRITENEVFFLPLGYIPSLEPGFSSSYCDFSMDASVFKAGATLKYMYRNRVDFSFRGVYNSWSLSRSAGTIGGSAEDYKNAKPWGRRPAIEINADLTVRPLDPFALTLGYYLGAERYTHIGREIKMDDINDLNFTASWNFNQTFGAYLKLNNLLFQKQELWYGYPMQGFNAMAGINLNF